MEMLQLVSSSLAQNDAFVRHICIFAKEIYVSQCLNRLICVETRAENFSAHFT